MLYYFVQNFYEHLAARVARYRTLEDIMEKNVLERKIVEKSAGVIGVLTGFMVGCSALGLSEEQIVAFCEATPNGGDLWDIFRARRDSPEVPEDYNFKSFMIEILAKTKHPVRQ